MPCQISGSFGQMSYWTTSEREIFHVFVHGGDNDSTDVKTYDAGKFQMDISYADRKVNDQCTGAIEIDLNEDVTGTTSGAKPDVKSIDASSCAYGGSGAWYSIIGNGSTFQASTCMDQTDHQTTMYVYSGRCAGLNCVDHKGGNSALCGLENDAGKSATVNFIVSIRILIKLNYHIFSSRANSFLLKSFVPSQLSLSGSPLTIYVLTYFE